MKTNIVVILVFLGVISGCKKQDDFLAAVPNNSLTIPKSVGDLQKLLLNESVLNRFEPSLGLVSGDEYTALPALYNAVEITQQNAYKWSSVIYPGNYQLSDWNTPYSQMLIANTVLDAIPTIILKEGEQGAMNTVKGTALFFRAKAIYNLVEIFAVPYDSVTARTDLGIPMRLSSNLNIKSVRSSVQDCYDQVAADLNAAITLLPPSTTLFTQPSSAVASGFLARVYLSIGKYDLAFSNADAFLHRYGTLTDFNTLSPVGNSLSSDYLSEDIFHAVMNKYFISNGPSALIDSNIVKSFDANDLRSKLFFHDYGKGGRTFIGTFDVQNFGFYCGIAVGEMYLIRAECEARMGKIADAMADLNTLLLNRYVTGTLIPLQATTADQALSIILQERKKELLYRGVYWTDLRRLNKDPKYAKTLTRIVKGTSYQLPPNDPKYALPIPDLEVQLSGIQQNPR
ncbi:RagB/SusD family nutrient uptake outer membrane protein [Chitinophaga sp. CC14]|uniref:RagB/SusD family nutrient uptake outer membrane protein n=1 Tax=Chitinophaga sp. CC14 TaxID=3029199 RepID=UPI003B7C91D5